MSLTDAADSKTIKKPESLAASLRDFVADLYSAPAHKNGNSGEAAVTAKGASSNGQLDFGTSSNLYGSDSHSTGASGGNVSDTTPGDSPKAGGVMGNGKPNPNWRQLREQLEQDEQKEKQELQQELQNKFGPHPKTPTEQPTPIGGMSKSEGSFAQGQNPNEISKSTINPSGVDQSSVGDCFFEAAVGSMANSAKGQEALQNMIKTNSDGSYTVTFPGDKSSPVTVTASDLADNQKNGQVEDSGKWARVIETAFLKYDRAEQYGSGLNASFLQSEGISHLANVAYSDKALQLLTGQSVSTDSMGFTNVDNREITLGSTSQANVARNLEAAFKNGEPVTAGASSGFSTYLGENDSGPMEGGHVYSVLSYDSKTGDVVVRNPWGTNDGTGVSKVGSTTDGITNLGDGKLEMSLDTFTNKFNSINFAGKNSYLNDVENVGNDLKDYGGQLLHTGSDLIHGHFGKLGGDLSKDWKDDWQTLSDTLYGVTDSAERGIKTVLADSFDGYSEMAHGLAHAGSTALHGLEHAGKSVVHDLNPMNW